MLHDPAAVHVLLFGGASATGNLLDDIWTLTSAAPAAFVSFGSGCAGSAGVPALDVAAHSLPWAGDTLTLELSNLPASVSNAFFSIGRSDTVWSGLTLPQSLAVLGFSGCTVWCSHDLVTTRAVQNGAAVWPLSMPTDPVWVGASFFTQGFSVDLVAGTLATSNAAEIVVGWR